MKFFHTKSKQKSNSLQEGKRRGAATVEFAVVVPVFGIFLAAMVEFGHAYMVQTALRGAAKKAARYGVANGVTTSDVKQEAIRVVSAAVDTSTLSVIVKDANVFDTSETPTNGLEFEDLPDIELANANTRQLYIIRLAIPYEDVALFPPFWTDNLTLHSQSVMRHE
ncbi:TadE/TadG family type IV pilus assembly protein [uncultured Rubinisphaera sp.]|uniref:TadE/TadG family type IV pilus assembly protein n=1 Tax=uncultured Rubinisphaera sp. TaxID=1678686 RepID=UPI0030DA3C69